MTLQPTGPLADTERRRIEFLVRRDGAEAARRWVERTLALYRNALDNPAHHASLSDYRPGFEASVRVFETWLAEEERSA